VREALENFDCGLLKKTPQPPERFNFKGLNDNGIRPIKKKTMPSDEMKK
jgi:hypothetical protein